jgi:hypothetical protein
VPPLASLAEFRRAIAGFAVADPCLVVEPAALAAAQQSLDESGFLLLGEVHGVRENPLLVRALMQAFGLTSLAIEWPDDLGPVVGSFLCTGTLADHPLLWLGDGRITAGHFAVLSERAAAGPLQLILFDGTWAARWTWSQRDEAMAGRILAACPAGGRTLVVAGNAHTSARRTRLGMPLGAHLARQRGGIRGVRIGYGSGVFYNGGPRRFHPSGSRWRSAALRQRGGELILDLPVAHEAAVPHRLLACPPGRP